MSGHTCHAAGCKKSVPPEMLMCRRHWFMVPCHIRKRIWIQYRAGQCDDWEITHAYAQAAIEAVRTVAMLEGRPHEEVKRAIRVYEMLDPGPGPGAITT